MHDPELSEGDAPIAQINIIPLVDVVLVLLIIFMVTTVFAKDDAKLPVNLPRGSRTQEEAVPPAEIIVTVDKDERVYVNGEQLPDIKELNPRIEALRNPDRKTVVVLRGDKAVVYGKILPVLDEVSHAEGLTITLAYTPPQSP